MMKFLAVCLFVIFLSGCGSGAARGYIRPVVLSDDQRLIFDLFTAHGNMIYLFKFDSDEEFSTMEFWVEVFEYGELVEDIGGLHQRASVPQALDGNFSVIITNDSMEFTWSLATIGTGGGTWTSRDTPTVENMMGRVSRAIQEPVPIADGEDIILYVALFAERGLFGIPSDMRQLITDPDWRFEEYPVAHILKARFSR